MVRFLISLLVSALVLGAVGVCQYALTRDLDFKLTNKPDSHAQVDDDGPSGAYAAYTLNVTLGFTAGSDPFALRTGGETEATRLLVRQGARVLYASADELQRGQTIVVTNLSFSGASVTLFVEAVPGPGDARYPCPLRLRLLRDEVDCDTVTLWSGGDGARVSGEVRLSLVPELATLDRGLGGR